MRDDGEAKLKELQDVLAEARTPVARGDTARARKAPKTIAELLAKSRDIYARYNAAKRSSE